MRDNEPIKARPALPSISRVVRRLLPALSPARHLSRALIFATVACFACGFTVQKTPEQTETAGAAVAPATEQIDTLSTAYCYGERKPGRDYRNCPPEKVYRDRRAYREYRDYGDRRDYQEKRQEKSRSSIPFIIATIVIIAAISALIYWLTPSPSTPDFCIPQAEKDKLLAGITDAFVAARGEATAANLPQALPLLKLAENGAKGAVNKIPVCKPS
jgi:hypothetical protein